MGMGFLFGAKIRKRSGMPDGDAGCRMQIAATIFLFRLVR